MGFPGQFFKKNCPVSLKKYELHKISMLPEDAVLFHAVLFH